MSVLLIVPCLKYGLCSINIENVTESWALFPKFLSISKRRAKFWQILCHHIRWQVRNVILLCGRGVWIYLSDKKITQQLDYCWFLNSSKYCGSVLKNGFVVVVVLVVADELLSNFQGISSFRKSCRNLSKMEICCGRWIKINRYSYNIFQNSWKIYWLICR